MEPQLRQRLILEAEIRALEKRKSEISFDLERLDSSHKETITQNTQQIKELTTRKNDLIEQVDKYKETLEALTAAYDSAKESLTDFKNKQLADLKKTIDESNKIAEVTREEARLLKAEAESLLKSSNEKEADLKLKEDALLIKIEDHMCASHEMQKRLIDDNERHEKIILTLTNTQTEIEQLKKSIITLQEEEKSLSIKTKEQKEKIEAEQHLLNDKIAANNILGKTLDNRARILDQQADNQSNEAILLKDRQAQLERAIDEWRQKGVVI